MAYLLPTAYTNYGLPAGTSADWVTAATALINSYCRRPDINITQYTERSRIVSGSQTVMMSYLPLAPLAPAATPLIAMQGKYAWPRRGDLPVVPLLDAALAFSLPGEWSALDPTTVDFDPNTGILTLPWNLMGLPFNEVEVTYTAGLATIGDDIKTACAQIVKNAQAQPSLNVQRSRVDTMWLQYFGTTLIDQTVQVLLRPYIAKRLG